jgi:hypothetical protein
MWRVAANILNKQSWRAGKGWSSSLGTGREANNTSPKNKLVAKCHKGPRTWKDYLDKRPKRRKMDMRYGTYWAVELMGVAKQISNTS